MIYIANARMPTEKAHGIQIAHMCEAFAAAGTTVELVLPRRRNPITQDIYTYYGVQKVFTVTYLPSIDLIFLGKFGTFISTLTFLISARIYLLFKKREVLYSREPLAALFFSKVTLELHALPARTTWFNELIWKGAQAIVVKTVYIKNELIKHAVDQNSILICSNGVNIKEFSVSVSKIEARKKCGLPEDKKIALYSGSFFVHSWKGVQIFLNAADLFASHEIAVLVGGSESDIKKITKKERIHLFGKQPHALVPYFLAAADVLVLPNTKGEAVSELYTSPLKLFEYMASNVPIVASDLSSVREVVTTQSVMLVEPNSPKALYNGIQWVLNNSKSAELMAEQAYQIALKNSWNAHAERILGFIKST